MMKYFRNAGYVQVGLGIGLTLGFFVTAYGNYVLSFFVMGSLFLAMVLLCIKDTANIANKNKGIPFVVYFRQVSLFYGSIYAFLFFAFVIGLISGGM